MVEFWTEKYPEYVKKISDNGNEIGTHSATHPYMSKLGESEIRKELTTSSEAIEKITGKKVELFRPPYGDYDDLLIETATDMGLYTIQWDVDSLDWKDLSASDIAMRIVSRTREGSIILCHNNGKHTAEDRRIFLRENSLSNLYRSPIFVQILRVQIIIIVSGSRNNVYQPVRNTNQFIALLYHVFRVGIAIVPSTHDHILRFHRCITFGMRQCSPYTSLFAKALYIADIMVGESTELLYYIFFLI